MRNTKQRILDTSRSIFNELGYSQVTIRMIASGLEMSSGNLNYHYRRREDILEALYFEMVEVFDKRIEVLKDQSISLEFVQYNIQISMQRMIEYRFFWTDLYNLLKSNLRIKAHFESVVSERVEGYFFLFENLINQGVLKKPTFSNEYVFLSERMIDYSNTWLYASGLYSNKKKNDEIVSRAAFHLLSMIYPYLTSKSKVNFRNLHPVFFIEE